MKKTRNSLYCGFKGPSAVCRKSRILDLIYRRGQILAYHLLHLNNETCKNTATSCDTGCTVVSDIICTTVYLYATVY